MEKRLLGWLLAGFLVFAGGCASQSGLAPDADKQANKTAGSHSPRCYGDMAYDKCM